MQHDSRNPPASAVGRFKKEFPCCICKKKIPLDYDIPPTWYGKYTGCKLDDVICSVCIVDHLDEWRLPIKK